MSISQEAFIIAQASMQLPGAALVPEASHLSPSGRAVEGSMLDRITRYIEQHLEYAELSPQSICRQVGISRSQLYRLFSGTGGVANYIRVCRLLKARAALVSLPRQRISNIAYKYGFTSHAHFSRVFKRYFGHTPWECVVASRGHRGAEGVRGDTSLGEAATSS